VRQRGEAGSRFVGDCALVRVVAHEPVVRLLRPVLAQPLVAAADLQQRFRRQRPIGRRLAHDLLVELNRCVELPFSALFRQRLLKEIVATLRHERGRAQRQRRGDHDG
jgi:hypothetical protein